MTYRNGSVLGWVMMTFASVGYIIILETSFVILLAFIIQITWTVAVWRSYQLYRKETAIAFCLLADKAYYLLKRQLGRDPSFSEFKRCIGDMPKHPETGSRDVYVHDGDRGSLPSGLHGWVWIDTLGIKSSHTL